MTSPLPYSGRNTSASTTADSDSESRRATNHSARADPFIRTPISVAAARPLSASRLPSPATSIPDRSAGASTRTLTFDDPAASHTHRRPKSDNGAAYATPTPPRSQTPSVTNSPLTAPSGDRSPPIVQDSVNRQTLLETIEALRKIVSQPRDDHKLQPNTSDFPAPLSPSPFPVTQIPYAECAHAQTRHGELCKEEAIVEPLEVDDVPGQRTPSPGHSIGDRGRDELGRPRTHSTELRDVETNIEAFSSLCSDAQHATLTLQRSLREFSMATKVSCIVLKSSRKLSLSQLRRFCKVCLLCLRTTSNMHSRVCRSLHLPRCPSPPH